MAGEAEEAETVQVAEEVTEAAEAAEDGRTHLPRPGIGDGRPRRWGRGSSSAVSLGTTGEMKEEEAGVEDGNGDVGAEEEDAEVVVAAAGSAVAGRRRSPLR